jgi:hypothetical protein
LAENCGEKTDHNDASISLTKTYKHGHDGITARSGATGDAATFGTSTLGSDFVDPKTVPVFTQYTGNRAQMRAQQARQQAM